MLYSAPLLSPLLASSHKAVYHLHGQPWQLFLPVLLLMALGWAVLTLLLMGIRRSERAQWVLWLAVLCSLPWFVFRSASVIAAYTVPPVLNEVLLAGMLVLFVGALALRFRRGRGVLPGLPGLMTTVFCFVALSGVLVLLQVLWMFREAEGLNDPIARQPRAVVHAAPHRGRVVWVLLDEMSQQEVFQTRYPGLELPTLDQLAQTSVVFTDVKPAGLYTEAVLPSLLVGVPVRAIRASASGRVLMLNEGGKEPTRFDEQNTVFADALRAGYGTGIAGWYNPYCRLMPQVLDRCTWEPLRDQLPGGLRTDAPLWRDVSEPFRLLGREVMGMFRPGVRPRLRDPWSAAAHIQEYQQISKEADAMLADPSIGFLLIHMPVPHPEGIYNRRTGQFEDDGRSSYVDNLALADRYLGHVEQVLRARGEWNDAALVVMGDHSWRVSKLWRDSGSWTDEDEAASKGGVDTRPMYLVKLPGETEGARVDTPFRAWRTRALLDGVLRGEIRTVAELQAWASRQRPR